VLRHNRDINATKNILKAGMVILAGVVGDSTAYVKYSSNSIDVHASGLPKNSSDRTIGRMELEYATLA
jgi:transposase